MVVDPSHANPVFDFATKTGIEKRKILDRLKAEDSWIKKLKIR